MEVIHDPETGKLTSTWYTKPTDTGLILNYHSLAPKRYKRSVVSGFVHRIYNSCSTWQNFHTSLEKAEQILKKTIPTDVLQTNHSADPGNYHDRNSEVN